MQIGSFNSIQDLLGFSKTSTPNAVVPAPVANSYKADSFSIANYPKPPYEEPAPIKQKFFDKPMIRIAGVSIASGAVIGGIGAGIGAAFGKVALGASIGAGVGLLAPMALVAYGLYSWGKK